jgi:hypothetical protein
MLTEIIIVAIKKELRRMGKAAENIKGEQKTNKSSWKKNRKTNRS